MTAEGNIVKGTSRLGTVLGLTTVIIGILAMTTPVIHRVTTRRHPLTSAQQARSWARAGA